MRDDPEAAPPALPHPSVLVDDILSIVAALRSRQNAWNAEVHRLFATDAAEQAASDRLTAGVTAAGAASVADGTFDAWLSRRRAFGVGADALREWFHAAPLLAATPFAAVVPCPRHLSPSGRDALAGAVDALGLTRFFVQTTPWHVPLSRLAPALIPAPLHRRARSKSGLGALPYVGVPCASGGDTLALLAQHPTLAAAVDRTPCLLLNDRVPRAAVCAHAVVVGGVCAAAEVALEARVAEKLGVGAGADALAAGLQAFVERKLGAELERRSYRVLLMGEAAAGREEAVQLDAAPLLEGDIRFSLLNIDTLDACEFELFSQAEILAIAQHMARRREEDNVHLPPVLRFLDGSNGEREDVSCP